MAASAWFALASFVDEATINLRDPFRPTLLGIDGALPDLHPLEEQLRHGAGRLSGVDHPLWPLGTEWLGRAASRLLSREARCFTSSLPQIPVQRPDPQAPTASRINASVDLFLQFRIEDPAEFIFHPGRRQRASRKKLQNTVSEN
ncbi:MAG: hypothetical protein R2873_31230 [Caldilineaceae bacterium]